ncbi:MAG: hypothetical protein GY711_05450 [bacterium]|nr:hypothetical protein [bacterium]
MGVSHPTDLLLDGVDLELSTPGYAAGDPKPDTLNLQFELRWQSKSGRPRTLELTCAKR